MISYDIHDRSRKQLLCVNLVLDPWVHDHLEYTQFIFDHQRPALLRSLTEVARLAYAPRRAQIVPRHDTNENGTLAQWRDGRNSIALISPDTHLAAHVPPQKGLQPSMKLCDPTLLPIPAPIVHVGVTDEYIELEPSILCLWLGFR